RRGIEAIISTGKLLAEYKAKWINDERGKWSRLIGANKKWQGKGLLPFGPTHVKRLIAIASDPRLGPHVDLLPSDSLTLHQLTRLTDERFEKLLSQGRIHPGMRRQEAAALTWNERRQDALLYLSLAGAWA